MNSGALLNVSQLKNSMIVLLSWLSWLESQLSIMCSLTVIYSFHWSSIKKSNKVVQHEFDFHCNGSIFRNHMHILNYVLRCTLA